MRLTKQKLKEMYQAKYGDQWFRIEDGIYMERYRRRVPPEGYREGVKHLAIDFSMLFEDNEGAPAEEDVLDSLSEEGSILCDVLEAVPVCEDFEAAARELIRCIHAIAALEDDWELGQIEIYVGRTGRTARNLRNRWDSHRTKKSRKHEYGLVAFVTDTDVIEEWESGAIAIVNALRDRNALCVSNIRTDGFGGIPKAEQSVVYLTFAVKEETDLCFPASLKIIDEVAREVGHTDHVLGLDESAIQRILIPTQHVGDRAHVSWHTDHKL